LRQSAGREFRGYISRLRSSCGPSATQCRLDGVTIKDAVMRLDQAARSIFLMEFVSGFFLAMRYFFKAKVTLSPW
jgi:hypothetical protein